MEINSPVLFSPFVIDGIRENVTPAQILGGVSAYPAESTSAEELPPMVDETPDVDPSPATLDPRKLEKYLSAVLKAKRVFPMAFAGPYTRGKIARALIDSIWKLGHFRIGDISVDVEWKWNNLKVGNISGFYYSVEALGEMLDALNIQVSDYDFSTTDSDCALNITADPSRRARYVLY